MKYSLKEHPYLLLCLLAFLCLVISVFLGVMYGYKTPSILATVLSGLGFLVLLVLFIKDLHDFKKGHGQE